MDFSLSHELGPRWVLCMGAFIIVGAFMAGLSNSVVFYELLPKDTNADILVFYQLTCPHCIAEIPTVKKLIANGYHVSAFNVFEYPDLARKYNITATPTTVIPRTGEKLVGEQSYDSIVAALRGMLPWEQTTAGNSCGVGSGATCSHT